MARIFTFGCSLTAYAWPTWAVILSYDLKTPVYNFAEAGMGNVGIYHSIVYADLIYKFTPEDKILILWSSWSREDRIKDKKWSNAGSVFNQTFYDRRFLKKYWDADNDAVKNATAIISVNKMYENIIAWQATWSPFFIPEAYEKQVKESKKIKDIYSQHLPSIPLYELDGVEPAFSGLVQDSHPDVNRHLTLVKDVILPALGHQMNPETFQRFTEVHNDIEKIVKRMKTSDLEILMPVIMKFVDSKPELTEFIYSKTMQNALADWDNL